MTLPREIREGLETFAIPLKVLGVAGVAVAAACIAPALLFPDKAIARQFETVGRNSAIASIMAGLSGLAIGGVLIKDCENALSEIESPAIHQFQVELFPSLSPSVPTPIATPAACRGCRHYDGRAYGGNRFVCAMHPYGWDAEQCPDWEGQKTTYRIVRIQGAAPGISATFYLIKNDEISARDALGQGEGIYSHYLLKCLCQKYKLKSVNGLPGCTFESNSSNCREALQELISSCEHE